MRAAFDTLTVLFDALSTTDATLARLRRLFGLQSSEMGDRLALWDGVRAALVQGRTLAIPR